MTYRTGYICDGDLTVEKPLETSSRKGSLGTWEKHIYGKGEETFAPAGFVAKICTPEREEKPLWLNPHVRHPINQLLSVCVCVCVCVCCRFTINFMNSSEDIAFHFNLRMSSGALVRNSCIGEWGEEERKVTYNPFQQGEYFEVSGHD